MMLGVWHQFPGEHCRMTGGAVSLKMSLYKIFAGTSRWPSAKPTESFTGHGGSGPANVPCVPHISLWYWGGENVAMQAFSMQDWILTVLKARSVEPKLEQEPEVGISPRTHPASPLSPSKRQCDQGKHSLSGA